MSERSRDWFETIPRRESQLCPATCWEPSADVYETQDGWIVKFDLSGVRPEDVKIELAGRQLSISGTRRDHSRHVGARYYRMEISYNRFQRTIELPKQVDLSRVASEFVDGMLLVHLSNDRS